MPAEITLTNFCCAIFRMKKNVLGMEIFMDQLTIYANAKINLALDVLNRRPDGYHTVRMIMQSLSLCDTLFCDIRYIRCYILKIP